MTRKCALIVDDSKTARQVLAKKLEAFQIDVETVESAATAIDYLYGNTPDAVFMDYEMPGMDGFQALKVIKSNPKTATIPVMMYTSKEGGIALSQARALGAIGVLPKKMEAEGLEAIVEQLHLLPHQHSLVENFPEELERHRSAQLRASDDGFANNVEYLSSANEPTDKVEYPEEIFDESVFLLKRQSRIYLKELMGAEERITKALAKEVDQVREAVDTVDELRDGLNIQRTEKKGGVYLLNMLLLLLVGYLLWQQTMMRNELRSNPNMGLFMTEFNDINDQISQLSTAVQNNDMLSLAGTGDDLNPGELSEMQPGIEFLSWAANRGTEFAYGENPFNDLRVAWLSELVNQLDKAGFSGIINLKAHYGNFCLSKSETGGLILAEEAFNFDDCQFSMDSKDTGFAQSSYQTLGFANYLNSVAADKSVPIEVYVEADSSAEPMLAYPASYVVKTAGEWNRIAMQNQRIMVTLYQKMDF
ncbi:MAG: response regulator [Gammaproteobacteria bacterium]|nr:response regulator [Gammaproteobacteria bacterium]